MPRPTLRTEQKCLGVPVPAGQPRPGGGDGGQTARGRNAEAARANGQLPPLLLDMPEGTAAIHPNTGIRKAHSVGCTQSMEHSSGMWYDGRELSSGTLENVDYRHVESPCGRPGALFMCYYDGRPYADSEACYSDGDDDDDDLDLDEDVLYDEVDDDDNRTDGAATNEYDDDEHEDDADSGESPEDEEELLYMRCCSDAAAKRPAVEHELEFDMSKLSLDQLKHMSSPVDPDDLHGRLMLVRGREDHSS